MHYQSRVFNQNIDLLQLHQLNAERYPFLLISDDSGTTASRYDIAFGFPQTTLKLTVEEQVLVDNEVLSNISFLDALKNVFEKEKLNHVSADLPFTGGWFVFLSYELAQEIEPTLKLPANKLPLPVAMAVRCPSAVIFDRFEKRFHVLAENDFDYLLDTMISDINQLDVSTALKIAANTNSISASIEENDAEPYLEQVRQIKNYIFDGDIFQANLSRLWNISLNDDVTDVALFNQLTQCNPAPFSALVKLDGVTVQSSSPERLVQVRDGLIQTRPIAGTRGRSSHNETDKALADELMTHPKENAEHVMLIDLERNDLGRICQPGSVEVNEFMVRESYRTVHHIVSNVRGKLHENITPSEVIRAVFPGGTITGCPKVRCMEILAEQEQQARGAYTGSLGYINRNGDMDLNILIRTMVRYGKKLLLRAGGGIVYDSDPEMELNETRAKASGLLNMFRTEE